ncbi:MAG: hypothetical protein IJM78_05510 [Prevotella sp.]|nr:hypothetical protein [Prevotella sp.]
MKNVMQKLLMLLGIILFGRTPMTAQADVTGYETVTVTIPATAYNADEGGTGKGAPQMARVKYNKTFPLVITSDDMGKTELTNNWAEVNGYPNINANVDLGIQPGGTKFLAVPYKKYYMQGESSDPADYQPMTYTDNVGKTQRYRMTSAIMPYLLKSDGSSDYSHIDANDAKLMLRTGWSFAQHDVDDISSVANISTAMTANSTQWANKVGIGLKVMVEPNGNHNYLEAGNQNSGVCWNIFQNSTSTYPDNSKTIVDWTNGTMPTTFSNKPTGGYIRSFFQGNESSWKTNVDAADGTRMIIGGTHGLGDEIKSHLRSASNVTNNAWVGSADEIWEYYHIYNNLQIENVNYADGNLTFDVKVPTYNKNQYRELTLNIPGLTATGAPTFSTASGKTVPVTGGYYADGGSGIGYTMNIGLEASINNHIEDLLAIYRDDQTNEFVKRDIQYLISQLWDGSAYTAQLNAAPVHDLTVQSSLGTTLATVKTDTDGDKSFAVPRYIVSGDKLYEVAANSERPNYAQTITTTSTPSNISYSEQNLSSLQVDDYTPKATLLVEGEDMAGMTILGADLDLPQTSHGRYWAMALGSGGMAGNLVSGTTATVTSALPRGKYKAVIGYGETYKSQGTYNYNLLVDGVQAATVSSSSAVNNAVTELTTAEFEVTVNNLPITLTTDNTNAGSRWIDYIYFVQTGTLEPQPPTAAIAASAGTTASIKTGNSITITANATQHGGSNYTGIKIYQCNDDAGTVSGDALATSNTETVSYTFTPSTAGTYYFKAVANDATLNDGTSEVITVTVVDNIDTYTLKIIDKSGSIALTTTVAAASLTTDPLPDAYRSPFAQNYKYYNTIAEAQANSGSAFATTDDWIQSTVYVGYDVDATKMAEGKVHAIWANGRYMHVIQNAGKSHNTQKSWHNAYSVQNQQYDVEGTDATRIGYSTGPYVQHNNITPTTLPFLDNSYMWELGTDPYNIKLKNKAYGFYQSSNAYNNQILYDVDEEASAETYCLLYWADKNGGNVDTSADYYRLMYKTDLTDDGVANKRTMYQWNNYWRINNDNNWNTYGKLYIKELPAININILNDAKEVECTLQGYFKSEATMPSDGTDNGTSYYTPFNLYRSYTSKHKWWYDAATTDAVSSGSAPDATKIENNGGNIYVTYTLDEVWGSGTFSDTKQPFHLYPSNGGTVYWYSVRLNPANSSYSWFLKANSDINQPLQNCNGTNLATSDYDSSHKEYYWAFKGTPYNLKIINMHHGDGYYLGVSKTATDIDAQTYLLPDTEDNNVTWEMTDGLSQNNMYPFFRLRASYNGENTSSANPLYISYNSSTPNNANLAKVAGGNQSIGLTEKTTTDITKVSLTADAAPYYVDEAITLTATAMPSPPGTDRVSSLVIEQEVEGVWTPVGTAYAGSDVAGVAEKDATTKTVTVTYDFTPTAEGTFNFRAHAVVDNEDQYSTAETTAGGDGDVVEIIATVKQLEPKNSSYTLTLIDKGGNELLTETSVPASRITNVNSLTNRNGDPFDNAYRSPLVTLYKYYEGTVAGKASAEAADVDNQVDWNTYTGTTVYVGYEVSDAIDLNGGKFSSLNDDASSLMQMRKARSASESTLVRDASKFGKMYLLKFKTNADYYSENGSDRRESNPTPSGSFVYPYTNGDGPIYVYDDARYQKQKDDGASTRTRWPWFLVSPNGDPYHVYVTSWQNAHATVTGKDANNKDVSTNYYSYLRTYYNSTTGTVVTNNVTDDPSTLDGSSNQILPTDYMILRGSGTDGLNYKLTTVAAISDGTTTERRTVTSIEQYWRNNPTAQLESGGEKNVTVVATDNATLESFGWKNYSAYVNAAKWDGSNYDNGKTKKYLNDNHWFQTISLGDGSLDIVEANIDGVLVLLDNHGWEIMRKPIVAKDDPDYETVKAALRKYDSPMVKQYKFYSTRNVKHKVAGYHKYDINRQTDTVTPTTPLTDAADRVDKDKTITSLADYEPHTSGGALTDLYVTYEVKDEYANSYTGAATEAATSASNFLLKQGSSYAKANGTAIESTSDASTADHWKLKPNFNIDAEMGYCYQGSGNSYDNELTQTALETLYYNGGTDSRNGFDPYNLQIQNATTSTYFTTNASTATLDAGAWSGNGSALNLQTIATRISPTGSDSKTLAVTNATFMAVQDQYGNMRLMPRFQHEQVVDNFATLADPATLSAYDATNAQTTQLTTPVTYHIIDNSGNDALQMTVTSGIGLSVPDALKSPMVSEYQFHSTQAHASAAETRATGDLTVAQEDVYVSYTVDATKMAAAKKYAISNASSNLYMHAVFQPVQTGSQQSQHYTLEYQSYDVKLPTVTDANTVNTGNLPFVDNTYLWSMGDDPYRVVLSNYGVNDYKYLKQNSSDSNNGYKAEFTDAASASTYCLLYWNGDTTSPYCSFRFVDPSNATETFTGETAQRYITSNVHQSNYRWQQDTSGSAEGTKFVIAELPEMNVNVVNAAGAVEYTLSGRYVAGATLPASNATPYFLQRAYVNSHTYYYTLAGAAASENVITAGTVPAAETLESNITEGKYNIYVRYELDSNWNSSNLFQVSNGENKHWYFLTSGNSSQRIYTDTDKNVKGSATVTDNTAKWALSGTPYALRIENRANEGYHIGVAADAASSTTNLMVYNEGDYVFDWELRLINFNNISAALDTKPVFLPQGAISNEAPLLYVQANGNNGLNWKNTNAAHFTFEDGMLVELVIIDKSGGEALTEGFTAAQVTAASGDPLSAELRSPFAKNFKYYDNATDAQNNSGENTVADLTAKIDQRVYVGYDVKTVEEGGLDFTGATGYTLRGGKRYMRALYNPADNHSVSNRWSLRNQSLDYVGATGAVDAETFPFLDNSHLWFFEGDPYNMKLKNKLSGWYAKQENNKNAGYRANMVTTDASSYCILYYTVENSSYYAFYNRDYNSYLYMNTGADGGSWRLQDTKRSEGQIYLRTPEQVNMNVVNPRNGEVESVMQTYYNEYNSGKTLTTIVPLFLQRSYTSGQTLYYSKADAAAATNAITAGTDQVVYASLTDGDSDGVKDIYLGYTLDSGWKIPEATDGDNFEYLLRTSASAGAGYWHRVNFANGATNYLYINNSGNLAKTNVAPSVTEETETSSITNDDKLKLWAFVGSPYSLKLLNMGSKGKYLGTDATAANNSQIKMVGASATNVISTWEMVQGLNRTGSTEPFLRLQNGLSGESPLLYLNDNGKLSEGSSQNGGSQIQWTYLKHTNGTDINFHLYNSDGNSMSLSGEAEQLSAGTGMLAAFQSAQPNLVRKFCTYEFYTSSDFAEEHKVTEVDQDATDIYVKWTGYTDDAPVFSTDVDNAQFYTMLGQYWIWVDSNDEIKYTNSGVNPNQEGVTTAGLHWSFIGTPYGLKIYNRGAKKYLKAASLASNAAVSLTGDAAEATDWELTDMGDNANQMSFSCKADNSLKWSSATAIGTTVNSKTLNNIIIPLQVYKEDGIERVDSLGYMFNYPATDETKLTASMLTSGSYGNRIYKHAFCDYTLYSDDALTEIVPAEGISFFGGAGQQKRGIWATYTVNEEDFRLAYLMSASKSGTTYFYYKNSSNFMASENGTDATALKQMARNNGDKIYRWQLTGDPYNLQITNLSMEGTPLGDDVIGYAQADENKLRLSNDVVNSVFEVIETADPSLDVAGETTWHVAFYLLPNESVSTRYTTGIDFYGGMLQSPFVYTNGAQPIDLTTAVLQHPLTWNVMLGGTNVATFSKPRVSEGVELTIDNMPESLRRHYLSYTGIYLESTCDGTAGSYTIPEYAVSDDDTGVNIYVKAEYTDDAPTFYDAAGTSSSDKWYMIHTGNNILYANNEGGINSKYEPNVTQTDRDNTQFHWRLVGTPYGVKLYNKSTQTYFTFPGTTTGTALTLTAQGSTLDLLDGNTADMAAISYQDGDVRVFASQTPAVNAGNYANGSTEFLSTRGISGLTLTLNFGSSSLRPDKTALTTTLGYQSVGKSLLGVMPETWRRAFCDYTYKWNGTAVTTVTDAMADSSDPIAITIDYEVNSPFDWSTATKDYTGKHWYYMVNNHCPNGELGKMVFRTNDPHLRVSKPLTQSELYLNYFEWCVIGDPYGFKMLNRYDPDQRYDEYIRVMDYRDNNNEGLQLEQNSTDTQNVFEMMPGLHSYNFWMHPVYAADYLAEYATDSYSYVGQNFNGSASIIPDEKKTSYQLQQTGQGNPANFRLEIQSDATLAEYVKYAGFVGGLKYDKVTDAMRADAADGDLSDEDKAAVRELVDDPVNIVQMTQGYYRIVPYTQEDGSDEHKYIRGYLDDRERTGSGGYNRNLKVETQTAAEYDPSTIFWFEGTTSDGTENGYPRYFIKTQGLSLDHTGLNSIDAESDYKCRYENLGGAIAQIKIASLTGDMPHDYLSCTSTATETSTDQCFDEQAGQYKTRFYMQKVGEGGNELSFKLKLNAAFGKSYASLYVPFDVEIPADIDAKPFYGVEDHNYSANPKADDKYTLFCRTLDYINPDYGEKIIPAATPVVIKSDDAAAEISFKVLNNAPHPDAKLRGDLDVNSERVNKISGIYLSIFDSRPELYTFGRENVYEGYTGETIDGKYTGRVGFFKRSTSALSKVLNPNRVFYISPFYNETQGSRGAAFVFEETPDIATGVSDVGTGVHSHQYSDGAVYDLQGRKVADDYESALSNRHLLKGIYIINGKKVVIK